MFASVRVCWLRNIRFKPAQFMQQFFFEGSQSFSVTFCYLSFVVIYVGVRETGNDRILSIDESMGSLVPYRPIMAPWRLLPEGP